MKIGIPSDGNDTLGFPFTFYKKIGGKRFPIPENLVETQMSYLVIDFIVSGILAFGIFNLHEKFNRRI